MLRNGETIRKRSVSVISAICVITGINAVSVITGACEDFQWKVGREEAGRQISFVPARFEGVGGKSKIFWKCVVVVPTRSMADRRQIANSSIGKLA